MSTSIEASWAQLELPSPRPDYPPNYDPSYCICEEYRKKHPQCSDKPIRYASGEIDLKTVDLLAGGFGVPWGHTRSFASQLSGNTDVGNKRAVVVDLHLDQAKGRTVAPDGKTITYTQVPGTIPQGGSASVFAGFYMPGDPFGAFSVTLRLA